MTLILVYNKNVLNNNLGELFRGSFSSVKLHPLSRLKVFRIMLETLGLVRKYTHMVAEMLQK